MNNTEQKEKALELCQKFGRTTLFTDCNEGYTLPLEIAKKCASIAVDEILELNVCWYDKQMVKDFPKSYKNDQTFEFWQEVKQEIEKL